MPLQPRFQRAAGSRRTFVDREDALAAFVHEWTQRAGGLRVLNVTGVGGIGKSRFLKECQERAGPKALTATLDLQIPAMREPDAALAVLRSQFGRDGVSFPRYDIAYLALWQRLHPHLRIALGDIADDRDSEVLRDLVESAAGVPVFRTVMGLLSFVDDTSSRVRRWRWLRKDPTLHQLDSLDAVELADAVTYLFAEDLRRGCGERRPLLCVDAYEALVGGSVRAGRTAGRDAWLRDLVAQLSPGLVLVASREPLLWESYDAGWTAHVRHLALDGLPVSARLELLTDGGIADEETRSALAEASSGMPFYLNLALDASTGGAATPAAVSGEELLERFLQHVHPVEVRLLEVLSTARIVDYEVFDTIATAFDLPRDRLSWERLVGYSFVQPTGTDQYQMHQLMATVLKERQSASTREAVHRALEALWAARAEVSTTDPASATSALREALHHRLHTGRIGADELLSRVDVIAEAGGVRSLAGVVDDVRTYCRTRAVAPNDLLLAAHCIEAETALLIGNPQRAAELTLGFPHQASDDATRMRLSLAAADAQRMLGHTADASARYAAVWRSGAGAQRRAAGLWAADLSMATGRFADAEAFATELTREVDADDHRMRGDIARLLHLARRFSFDFGGSRAALTEAREHYRTAGSAVGLAQLTVNEAELLAWTEPAAAEPAAAEAIRVQEEIGAWHELGKAWTARAFAALRLGRVTEAEAHVEAAFDTLGRARYRSGLARAQLVRALILVHRGDHTASETAALAAVREFEATEVYPTLVLAAVEAMRQAGSRDPAFQPFAERARATIVPVGSLADLEERIRAWTASLRVGSV